MGTYDHLRNKALTRAQVGVVPEDFVRLPNEHLLHLRMQMHLGLFDEDEMEWRDDCVISGFMPGFSHPHPLVAERHQTEHHRD